MDMPKSSPDLLLTYLTDMRTPLTSLKGHAQLLGHVGAITEEQRALIERMLINIDRMDELITAAVQHVVGDESAEEATGKRETQQTFYVYRAEGSDFQEAHASSEESDGIDDRLQEGLDPDRDASDAGIP